MSRLRSGGPRQIDVVGDLIVTSAWGHQAILGVNKNSGEVLVDERQRRRLWRPARPRSC